MRTQNKPKVAGTALKLAGTALVVGAMALMPAQAQTWTPGELDNLVSRIALYPDPLLAQVLTASTYADQIPDAAAYADQHSYLQGDQLEQAIEADNPPWDPSVVALIPFPSVLDTMDRDPNWTRDLGDAVLESRDAVMDAVQRMRHRAYEYGSLRDCEQYRVVNDGPWIEVLPVDPAVVYVPVYDPYWIFARPRAGFTIAITFGARIAVAPFYRVGWRTPRMDWRTHAVVIDHRPWQRTMENRTTYVHQYREPVVIRPSQVGRPMAAQGERTRTDSARPPVGVTGPPVASARTHDEAARPRTENVRPQAGAAYSYHETHEVRPNRPDRAEQRQESKPAPQQHQERREPPARDKK